MRPSSQPLLPDVVPAKVGRDGHPRRGLKADRDWGQLCDKDINHRTQNRKNVGLASPWAVLPTRASRTRSAVMLSGEEHLRPDASEGVGCRQGL